MAVGGDGYREWAGRTGELDASRKTGDPWGRNELDTVEVVTGAEGAGRVARSRPPRLPHSLSFTDPRREGEEN